MPLEQTVTGEAAGETQKQVDRGIREMVSALTHHIADLQKPGSSHQENEDENGVRIITLAGSNIGASMRGELDEKAGPHRVSLGEPDALGAYVNSNFQAVNNSIMLGGSYSSNDPGVHMDITDLVEQGGIKPEKPGRKGKKKEKENAQSDQFTEHTD